MQGKTINGCPVYSARLDDEQDGFFCVSLVDDPAVDRDFIAFSREKKMQVYAIADEERRIVRGVLMRADFPIYRMDSDGGYYVVFDKETIRLMAERFIATNNTGNVNIMHIPGSQVAGVELVQLFIKDTAAGISPAGFEDVEDGSLFGEYHVGNTEVWEKIKSGQFRGFSIEGLFTLSERFSKHNDQTSNKLQNMTKTMQKIKAALVKILAEFGAVTTDKGVLVWDGDDDLKAGFSVMTEDENGERKPAPDGDYKTEDGKTISVKDGKVIEISDPKAEVEAADDQPDDKSAADKETDTEKDDRIEKLEGRIEELEATLAKVVEALGKSDVEIKLLKHRSAGRSAHEEFHDTNKGIRPTGDPKLDRLARIIRG